MANETELHIMRLAAISTASIQNTENSIKERITRGNPYWTQAYEDVCVAVDREMKLRQQLEAAQKACAEMRGCLALGLKAYSSSLRVFNQFIHLESKPNNGWPIEQDWIAFRKSLEHSLSTDCGKGQFVAMEKVKALVDAGEEMAQWQTGLHSPSVRRWDSAKKDLEKGTT